jgi:hypothetical protein
MPFGKGQYLLLFTFVRDGLAWAVAHNVAKVPAPYTMILSQSLQAKALSHAYINSPALRPITPVFMVLCIPLRQ